MMARHKDGIPRDCRLQQRRKHLTVKQETEMTLWITGKQCTHVKVSAR